MNARELRIGNYVQDSTTDELIMVSAYTITQIVEHSWKAKPIELTEDWLEKFGFKKDANSNYWLNLQTHYLEMIFSGNDYYPIYCQIPEFSSESELIVGLKSIKYVHQLQNIYFVLTGEEL
jgi:hypothetical protein